MNYPLVCLPLFPGHVCTQDMAQSSHGSAPVPREQRIKVMNTVTDIQHIFCILQDIFQGQTKL